MLFMALNREQMEALAYHQTGGCGTGCGDKQNGFSTRYTMRSI
jgi:N-methylhydantoinase B/oxoprolinase/acetone carboxylase alpha subunit